MQVGVRFHGIDGLVKKSELLQEEIKKELEYAMQDDLILVEDSISEKANESHPNDPALKAGLEPISPVVFTWEEGTMEYRIDEAVIAANPWLDSALSNNVKPILERDNDAIGRAIEWVSKVKDLE